MVVPNPFLPQPPDAPVTATDPVRIRRRVAENLGYPEGALDVILKLEADYPGWSIIWSRSRVNRPESYSAHRPDQASTDAIIYASDLTTIAEKIASATPVTASSDA